MNGPVALKTVASYCLCENSPRRALLEHDDLLNLNKFSELEESRQRNMPTCQQRIGHRNVSFLSVWTDVHNLIGAIILAALYCICSLPIALSTTKAYRLRGLPAATLRGTRPCACKSVDALACV